MSRWKVTIDPAGPPAEGPPAEPVVLPMVREQPRPVQVKHCYMKAAAGQVVTALWRLWRAEDVGRCRLCATCTAGDDSCLMLVNGTIPPEKLELFSTVGLVRQANPMAPKFKRR